MEELSAENSEFLPACICKHNCTGEEDKSSFRRVFLLGGTYYMDKKFVKRIQKMDSMVSNEQPLPVGPVDYVC
jgi:hypothetical protein